MKAPDLYWGKALDNRLGLGVMIEVMKNLESINHDCDVVAVGSVQEEIGIRGAPCAAALTHPDLAIILEAPPADDTLSVSRRQSCLGKGPQLRLLDGNTLFPPGFCEWVRAEAKAMGVECQVSVKTSGGTNAKAYRLHAMGLPCVVIGVPARYIHSHVGVFHWQDYLDTINLVTALVSKLSAGHVGRFRNPWVSGESTTE
jgi:endoglucanase